MNNEVWSKSKVLTFTLMNNWGFYFLTFITSWKKELGDDTLYSWFCFCLILEELMDLSRPQVIFCKGWSLGCLIGLEFNNYMSQQNCISPSYQFRHTSLLILELFKLLSFQDLKFTICCELKHYGNGDRNLWCSSCSEYWLWQWLHRSMQLIRRCRMMGTHTQYLDFSFLWEPKFSETLNTMRINSVAIF